MSYINLAADENIIQGQATFITHPDGLEQLLQAQQELAQQAQQGQAVPATIQKPSTGVPVSEGTKPTIYETYRGWVISDNIIPIPWAYYRGMQKSGFKALPPGVTEDQLAYQDNFGASATVFKITAPTIQEVKKLVDDYIAGTYVPPKVARAREVAHNRAVEYSSGNAFRAAIPVPMDQVHSQRSGTAKGSYKGWILREYAYSLKSELQGLGFLGLAMATITKVEKSNLQSAPFHPLWVAVLDADPQQTLTAPTQAELKAKIDNVTPAQIPANAPVAAETISKGKKLAIGGGLAAAAALLFMQ